MKYMSLYYYNERLGMKHTYPTTLDILLSIVLYNCTLQTFITVSITLALVGVTSAYFSNLTAKEPKVIKVHRYLHVNLVQG